MADDSKNNKDDAAAQAKARAAAMAKATSTPLPQIYRETIVELKKTTWPDRETLQKSVTVVLALIGFTLVWVWVIGIILNPICAWLFKVSSQ